ncbi:MAG: hypothetical protein R3F20_10245 [Planctomycetota bacterium]
MSDRTAFRIGLLIAALLATFAFAPVLDAGFVNYDDPSAVIENPVITGPGDGNLGRVLTERREDVYLPLWFASYWVDHAISGREPRGYHLVNLALHALSTALVGLLLFRLTRRRWPSFAASLLFAVHPVATESVAWVTERKGLLALALALGSLVVFFGAKEGEARSRRRLAAAAALLGAALLAKATVFVFPPIAMLARACARRTVARPRLPSARALFSAWGRRACCSTSSWLSTSGTASFAGEDGGVGRVIAMLGVLGRYALHLALPVGLSVHYPTPFGAGFGLDQVHGLIALGALVGAGLSFRRSPGPIAFGVLWIGIALLPFNNLLPRFGIPMADRYLYGALPGAVAALAFLLARFGRGHAGRAALAGVVVALLVAGGIALSRHDSRNWRDSEALWSNAIEHAPAEMLPRLQLGAALEARGAEAEPLESRRLASEAVSRYEEALARARGPREAAQARAKLGPALVRLGRHAEALAVFDALEAARAQGLVKIEDVERDSLRISRSSALMAEGRREEARRELQAVSASPELRVEARNQLAVLAIIEAADAIERAGPDAEAQTAAFAAYEGGLDLYREIITTWPRHLKSRTEYLRSLIRANWIPDYLIVISREARRLVDDFPESAEAHFLRARVYAEVDPKLAEDDLKIAARLDPSRDDVPLFLADLVRSQGRNKEAIAILKIGRRTRPDSDALRLALAQSYLSFAYHHRNTGALDLAAAATAQALELDADLLEARTLRGEVYSQRASDPKGEEGDRIRALEEARRCFEAVLAEAPREPRALAGLSQLYRREGFARIYASIGRDPKTAADLALEEQGYDAFLKAERLTPGDEDGGGPRTMMMRHAADCADRAREHLRAGETEEALRLADRAVLFDPDAARNWATLAMVRRHCAPAADVVAAYEGALSRDAKDLESLYELGRFQFERAEWAAAITRLEAFLAALDEELRVLLEAQVESAQRMIAVSKEKAAAGGGEGG